MPDSNGDSRAPLDAVVVGAGFAGMYMLRRLRGLGMSARAFEAGSGVGGTWYWNRYPGARCDVESMQYSYQFCDALQREWEWSERYAAQPEILRYANHVADRFDLRRDIAFDTRVAAAAFDDAAGLWTVETAGGARVRARFCVMATGCLSAANRPEFPGREDYRGAIWHTGRWPREGVDFAGMRVGVIGTGSSAIQSIPVIAERARALAVFQRTPNYSIPARNRPLGAAEAREIKANYPALRALARKLHAGLVIRYNPASARGAGAEERRREYEARWREGGLGFAAAFKDLLTDPEANASAAEFVRAKIRETVTDPEVARLLSPRGVIGCKRLCVDTGYYATFNRPNVELVDVRGAPIERLTAAGLHAGGREFALDAIVFATGFDAMTGALRRIDIRGAGGRRLRDKWRDGPRAYLGLMAEGFPNLFTVTGPGSPSVLANMILCIEQHVDWIADCLDAMRRRGLARITPRRDAEDAWCAHVNDLAEGSLRASCSSWYVGANVPGKPRVFMPYIGGFPEYAAKCAEVAARGYEGFELTPHRPADDHGAAAASRIA